MKKSSLFLLLLFAVLGTFAQTGGFNYKALISDNGNILQNQSVSVRFTFLDNGTEVYKELHASITDENGIVCIIIGDGAVISGDFDLINWGNTISLQVEIDSGSGFADFGTNEFKYVPYAKYANNAGNVFSGDYTDLTNTPNLSTVATSGSYTDLSNTPNFATVATSGSYTDLTNIPNFTGWDTDASDDFSGSYNDLTNVPSFATVATSGSYTDLTNIPSFATVATSGNYNDLISKPDFTGWDTDASNDVTSLNDLSDARVIGRCTFIGGGAGITASSSGDLVGVGLNSLHNATSADYSVAVGNFSLQNVTSGSYNTAIGYNSGSNGNGSRNVFIGSFAGLNETGSNKLYIENSDSSLPLIGGDFSTDEVTINGSLSIKDGTQGAGRVLVSDVNGKASWGSVPQQDKVMLLSPVNFEKSNSNSYSYQKSNDVFYIGSGVNASSNMAINLPEGVYLDHITIYYYDNSSNDLSFSLQRTDLTANGVFNVIDSYTTIGNSSSLSFVSLYANETVVANNSYVFKVSAIPWDGYNTRIAGLKVYYKE